MILLFNYVQQEATVPEVMQSEFCVIQELMQPELAHKYAPLVMLAPTVQQMEWLHQQAVQRLTLLFIVLQDRSTLKNAHQVRMHQPTSKHVPLVILVIIVGQMVRMLVMVK